MTLHERPASRGAVKHSTDRAFGFVMAGACAVFGGVAWWKSPGGSWSLWLAGASVVFLTLALFWNGPLKPLNTAWSALGDLLHKVVSPLVMGGLFFLVITPVGLAMRLMGKDLLALRLDPKAKSYWIEHTDKGPISSMDQQF
jgi:hypothetical protein